MRAEPGPPELREPPEDASARRPEATGGDPLPAAARIMAARTKAGRESDASPVAREGARASRRGGVPSPAQEPVSAPAGAAPEAGALGAPEPNEPRPVTHHPWFAAGTPSGEPAPGLADADPRLVPALKAAAAARAAAARIRAERDLRRAPVAVWPLEFRGEPALVPGIGLTLEDASSRRTIRFRPLRRDYDALPYSTAHWPLASLAGRASADAPAPEAEAAPEVEGAAAERAAEQATVADPPPEDEATRRSGGRRFARLHEELAQQAVERGETGPPWGNAVPVPVGNLPIERPRGWRRVFRLLTFRG